MGVELNEALVINLTKATEAAAIAARAMMGMGNEKAADQLAVDAMRSVFNQIEMDGRIVIGEGERDEAPMLYIGENVGTGRGPKIDIAVDPLEGTTILATGAAGSLAVAAMAPFGTLLHAPDVYMDKIAIGIEHKEQIVDLDLTPRENLKNIALAKKCNIEDLMVMILDRDRHTELIANVRAAGARVRLIKDGDIAAVIATTMEHAGVDVYMGSGGAPEGVLAASALAVQGGQMCGRLLFRNDDEKSRAKKIGIVDLNKKYLINDMVSSDVIFCATGVTNGPLLKGVQKNPNGIFTHSLVMHRAKKHIRFIEKMDISACRESGRYV